MTKKKSCSPEPDAHSRWSEVFRAEVAFFQVDDYVDGVGGGQAGGLKRRKRLTEMKCVSRVTAACFITLRDFLFPDSRS